MSDAPEPVTPASPPSAASFLSRVEAFMAKYEPYVEELAGLSSAAAGVGTPLGLILQTVAKGFHGVEMELVPAAKPPTNPTPAASGP